MNFAILGAILKKDVLSLAPIATLVAMLFLGDALIVRLDLLSPWSMYRTPVLLAALAMLLMLIFQLDAPASLTDDWLCRPIRKRELLGAKLLLALSTVYLPRAVGVFFADVSLGFSLTESFLDAVLLQDTILLFSLPILLFTAIVTRTLGQGFGVLFAIFIGVFVLPTPFVRPPGPLTPGIRDALLFSGIQWLAATPAQIVSLILAALGFWLVYWRRRIAAARLLMTFTVCVATLLVLLPMGLLPWNATWAIHKALRPESYPAGARTALHNMHECFPATRRAELSTDAAFIAATHRSGVSLWDEEALRDTGANSIAFLSHMEPRGLPRDWRVKLNYVQATYSAGRQVLYSLRPARYFIDRGSGPLAHAWMLPESALQRLNRARPTLEFTYSLTLLKPREYRVPTDGKRHALPGLGYCSAHVDEPGNRIDVDCFSAFSYTTQISAELNEIPATRDYDRAELAPNWAQWPFSRRAKLTVASPRLAQHDTITVTAWDVAGYVDQTMAVPGILGADLTTCPLPSTERSELQSSRWRDVAPHEVQQVYVEEGVQLEVLDFGGSGSPQNPPILLLPGLGATAHSYDELAPLLARKHRVLAITRRGAGYSSKPDFGFDTPRLAQDVLEVIKAMNLGKVVLVGHSIAGEELTWLGAHHADRFFGLVYLDAAYDRSGDRNRAAALRLRELNRSLPPEPPIPPESLRHYDAMTKLLEQRGHVHYPEGELIAAFRVNSPFLAGTPSIDARTQQAINAAILAPDYASVTVPALAIYAFEDSNRPLPRWYDANDEQLKATLAEIARIRDAMKRQNIDSFRRNAGKGRVLELQNSTHYIFLSNQSEVLEAIEDFTAELGQFSESPHDTRSSGSGTHELE